MFYAGETLSCTISFTNPVNITNKTVKSSVSNPIPFSSTSNQAQTRSTPINQRTSTFSSLASSTLAFLTRTAPPSPTAPVVKSKPAALVIPSNNKDEDETIPIELDSPTARSSIDTYLLKSPRSSMDSMASFRSTRRYSSSPLKKPVSEHLLCGFAQVVGSFVADPMLIHTAEFDPLKRHTMYNPQGGFGGGGGLMVAKSESQLGIETRNGLR